MRIFCTTNKFIFYGFYNYLSDVNLKKEVSMKVIGVRSSANPMYSQKFNRANSDSQVSNKLTNQSQNKSNQVNFKGQMEVIGDLRILVSELIAKLKKLEYKNVHLLHGTQSDFVLYGRDAIRYKHLPEENLIEMAGTVKREQINSDTWFDKIVGYPGFKEQFKKYALAVRDKGNSNLRKDFVKDAAETLLGEESLVGVNLKIFSDEGEMRNYLGDLYMEHPDWIIDAMR